MRKDEGHYPKTLYDGLKRDRTFRLLETGLHLDFYEDFRRD